MGLLERLSGGKPKLDIETFTEGFMPSLTEMLLFEMFKKFGLADTASKEEVFIAEMFTIIHPVDISLSRHPRRKDILLYLHNKAIARAQIYLPKLNISSFEKKIQDRFIEYKKITLGIMLREEKQDFFKLSSAMAGHISKEQVPVGLNVALAIFLGGSLSETIKLVRNTLEKFDIEFDDMVEKKGWFRWWMIVLVVILIKGLVMEKQKPGPVPAASNVSVPEKSVIFGKEKAKSAKHFEEFAAGLDAEPEESSPKYEFWTQYGKLLIDVDALRSSIMEAGLRLHKEDAAGGATEDTVKECQALTEKASHLLERAQGDKKLPVDMVKSLRLPRDIETMWTVSQDELTAALRSIREYARMIAEMAAASRGKDIDTWNRCLAKTNILAYQGALELKQAIEKKSEFDKRFRVHVKSEFGYDPGLSKTRAR